MSRRIFISINLVALALVLAFLPQNMIKKGEVKPKELNEFFIADDYKVDVDLAARYVVENNSSIQFIDLRSAEEFAKCNIPTSINIPYEQLLDKKWQGYLIQTEKTNILYSNGSTISSMAVALLNSNTKTDNKILHGGLNNWFEKVMNSEFKGTRITARENIIFENRRKAKNLFVEMNSLPDSVKSVFLNAKVLAERKLDGGCE